MQGWNLLGFALLNTDFPIWGIQSKVSWKCMVAFGLGFMVWMLLAIKHFVVHKQIVLIYTKMKIQLNKKNIQQNKKITKLNSPILDFNSRNTVFEPNQSSLIRSSIPHRFRIMKTILHNGDLSTSWYVWIIALITKQQQNMFPFFYSLFFNFRYLFIKLQYHNEVLVSVLE